MFKETPSDDWHADREKLLQCKLSEIGLKIEGTRLETIVDRLYKELDDAKIRLKPRIYLSDEWGCPEGLPIIGVPFYLADEKLSRIENELMDGIEAETDEEILRYLRHEAGHAFNYAYKLYETKAWGKVFGPYSRPYTEDYKPYPFSRNFVRHIAGWYAQKHPDEDFAETFAVWLSPDSDWRETYKDWGCYKKLVYVDKIIAQYGPMDPVVIADNYDVSCDLQGSITEHYERFKTEESELPAYFDVDLKEIFSMKVMQGNEDAWLSADQFLVKHRRSLIRNITYWTGLNDTTVRSLIQHFVIRCKSFEFYVNPEKSDQVLMEITVYATTLCMNNLYKGHFVKT